MSAIDYIKTKLSANEDADDIMAGLVVQFTDINVFKSELCDDDKCKMFFSQGDAPTNPLIQTQLWRLHYKITAICKDTCDIAEIKTYYETLTAAKKQYKSLIITKKRSLFGTEKISEEKIKNLIEELSSLHLNIKNETSGGGNQKGGVLVEKLINLIAGFDVISATISTMTLTEVTYNKICDLCSYIAEDISKTSNCMKSIMGDTLYKGIKIVAKSIFGASAIKIIYNNIDSLLSAVLSIVRYVPAAAQLVGVLSFGFIVTAYIDGMLENVNKPKIYEKFKNLIDDIDKLTSDGIQARFTELLTTLKTNLDQAKASEIEEMYGQLQNMLSATPLSPDVIDSQSTVNATFDTNFKKIRRDILLQLIAEFNKKYNLEAPNIAINEDSLKLGNSIVALWGAIQIDDPERATISEKVLPFITQFEKKKTAMVVDPTDYSIGGKPRRKTTRKPHKKPHKKSRKHRRSRKH